MREVSVSISPSEIELKSFEIIKRRIGEHSFSEEELSIVIRVIHATGDLDYARNMRFHPKAVEDGVSAIEERCLIVSDTEMGRAGMTRARSMGCEVRCFVHDSDVIAEARDLGVTRSVIAIRKAARYRPGIVAIGNSPTALIEAIKLIEKGVMSPKLIIGVPVGFVMAAESKEMLVRSSLPIPYITSLGNKGGSTVAAAIVNGLALLAGDDERG